MAKLQERLAAAKKNESRRTFAEALYWLNQYKGLAGEAIKMLGILERNVSDEHEQVHHLQVRLAEVTAERDKYDKLLQDAYSKYEELRKIIDGGSESMTHADALRELNVLVSENDRLAKHSSGST